MINFKETSQYNVMTILAPSTKSIHIPKYNYNYTYDNIKLKDITQESSVRLTPSLLLSS